MSEKQVLELLREIRAEQAEMKADISDLKNSVGVVEIKIGRWADAMYQQHDVTTKQVLGIERRFQRMERHVRLLESKP